MAYYKKVHVTGYPSYIQQTELGEVFSKYGPVTIEKFNNEFTILMFALKSQALKAIRDSGKVNVYGEFMTVTALGGQFERARSKKSARNKKKGRLVKPFELDLSGNFYSQLANLLEAVRLSQGEVARLAALYQDLATALQEHWPGCMAIPFGSITTGLGVKDSDADCFIHNPPEQRHANGSLVNRAKKILRQQPRTFADVFSIPQADTPIVEFVHVPTGFHCVITFKTRLGTQNSRLITFLLQSDPRLTPMAVVVKYWARVNGFSGTGKMTNYALTMLVLFYLQQAPVSILPPVELLQRDPETELIVDGWNAGFSDDYDRLPESTNTWSISELLGGFFQYYSTFNFTENIVCPFLGVPVKKKLFRDLKLLPPEFHRYADNMRTPETTPLRMNKSICVQDPFEHSHNVSSMITHRMSKEITEFFKFAAAAYDREKLNGCNKLLNTILQEKPKILREKLQVEYRLFIVPRVIERVKNPDWMSVVREVTVKIFENMCKIKLKKVHETLIEPPKKPRNMYMCVLTKAIWKREHFSKIYNMVKLNFLNKQTFITEKIRNFEKEVFYIQFRLTLTFNPKTRYTTSTIKLIEGDPFVFREFGNFFRSVIRFWYSVLLKSPRLHKPVNNEIEPEVDHDVNASVSQTDECNANAKDDAQATDHDVNASVSQTDECNANAKEDAQATDHDVNASVSQTDECNANAKDDAQATDHDFNASVSQTDECNANAKDDAQATDHDVNASESQTDECNANAKDDAQATDHDVNASVSQTDECNANAKDDAQATDHDVNASVSQTDECNANAKDDAQATDHDVNASVSQTDECNANVRDDAQATASNNIN